MKKIFLLCVVSVIALWGMAINESSENGKTAKGKHVEISFDYEKKPGPGSNQYAVWIENDKNEVKQELLIRIHNMASTVKIKFDYIIFN